MYPTLYHLVYSLFGAAPSFLKIIPMLGLFIALGFIAANIFGARELKRREKLGWLKVSKKKVIVGKAPNPIDIIINGALGFIIGFKVIHIFSNSEVLDDFVGFLLSGEGNIIAGVIVGIGMAYWKYREVKKDQLDTPVEQEITVRPHEHLGNITLIGILGGIGGALIFAFLEQPVALWSKFMQSGNISDLNGGLTVYGGVIMGVLGNIYYFWKNKLPISQYLDALGPTVLLAYGIGRIGCQLAGDGDWGIDNLNPKPDWMAFLPDWMWAFDYPNNINNEGIEMTNSIFSDYNYRLENPVYPTPIYEVIMSLGLFAVLWNMRKRIKIPWILFSMYILFTGLERLLIETIRVNEPYASGIFKGYNQAQVISTSLILLGAIGIGYFYKKSINKISTS